jgi:hypothetical protein
MVKRPYEIGEEISREGFPSEGWQGALSLSPWHGIGGRFGFGISPYSLPLFPLGWCAFALPAIVRLLCRLGNVIIAGD